MIKVEDARVAVLMGGPGAEAEVSRVSAAGVARALGGRCAAVATIELDAGCVDALRAFAPDLVFPALHGPPGEDGTVQGLLTLLGLPYVGSDVHASATAMDKALAKQVFRDAGLPLAPQYLVRRAASLQDTVAAIQAQLGPRVVVKPCRQGSALGVTLVGDADALGPALTAALARDDTVLVESWIVGREITVGVLECAEPGGTETLVHPVIEILTPENSWYDYEHRYTQGLSQHRVPAELDAETTTMLQGFARSAHEALGCRDLSRADFILGEDGPILLEVNTLPGMTPTSLYPDGAAALGFPFPELLATLVRNALLRGPDLTLGPPAADGAR